VTRMNYRTAVAVVRLLLKGRLKEDKEEELNAVAANVAGVIDAEATVIDDDVVWLDYSK
jgi:hypothetical protein